MIFRTNSRQGVSRTSRKKQIIQRRNKNNKQKKEKIRTDREEYRKTEDERKTEGHKND